MNFRFKKVDNPHVQDTIFNRYQEWVCRVFGCIITGAYTGLPQSRCKRCGHKNWCASENVPEWSLPDRFTNH